MVLKGREIGVIEEIKSNVRKYVRNTKENDT